MTRSDSEAVRTPQGYITRLPGGAVRLVRHLDGLGMVTLDLTPLELAVIRGEDVAPMPKPRHLPD